jgi:hypothetical protein
MAQSEIRKELIDKFNYISSEEAIGSISLKDWEARFLLSISFQLENENGFLTELQIEKLEQIYEKYNR